AAGPRRHTPRWSLGRDLPRQPGRQPGGRPVPGPAERRRRARSGRFRPPVVARDRPDGRRVDRVRRAPVDPCERYAPAGSTEPRSDRPRARSERSDMTTITDATAWEARSEQLDVSGRAFIGNESVDAHSGETFEKRSPVDG